MRLINIAFTYYFKETRLATTGGSDLEQNKDIGQVSTIMRLLTGTDGDLGIFSGKISETEAGIGDSSLKQKLIRNHVVYANRGKKVNYQRIIVPDF